MKTSTTFSILIWVNTSRVKDNQVKLFTRVTVNQKRVNISLKRSIDISTWDKNKSQVKGSSQQAREKDPTKFLDLMKIRLL